MAATVLALSTSSSECVPYDVISAAGANSRIASKAAASGRPA